MTTLTLPPRSLTLIWQHGMRKAEWKLRDDGTYSLVVIMTVDKQASQPG
ncbi:MAG: hypothetical protein MUO64_14725 [Anaerolineales bacterium]|nr:hypothetical protein [Anaerolineales bacterium]